MKVSAGTAASDDRPVCPLCGSTRTRTVYEITVDETAQNWIVKEYEPDAHRQLAQHVRDLWGRDKGASVECNDCGFNFAFPYVAGDATFYELAFGPSGYPKDKWEFARTIEALERESLEKGRALEIGSGYGYFLDQVSPRFFAPSDVTSIEYNPTAREKLARKGYRVITSDLDELVAAGERYKVIFMFQVLEHRDRPHEIFEAFRRLMGTGGQLFISVPKLASVRFSETHGGPLEPPPNHIGFWSEHNLATIAEQHGFEVCAIAAEPFNFRQFIKWDAYLAYRGRALNGGPVLGRLYSNRRKRGWRWLYLASILALAPMRLPVWIEGLRKKEELSLHIWAHFRCR